MTEPTDMPRSLHQRILQEVQEKIISGTWPPGYRIPFETDMARDYGCSRMTVNKALTQLTRAGLLVRNRKSGTFVKAPQSLSAAMEISDIRQEVERAGKAYSYHLLNDTSGKVDVETLEPLVPRSFQHVRQLTCLHLADGQPFCLEQRIINIEAVPDVAKVDFTTEAPGHWLLQQVPWNAAEHQIFACAANRETADMLHIETGAACLVIERTTRNQDADVTWARLTYPGDRHRLFASFSPSE